jgi:hypothetical protein
MSNPRLCDAVAVSARRGGYVNFMMDDGDDSRLKATYGDNYDRLVALKAKYDPTNFFCVTAALVDDHVCRTVRSCPKGLVGAFFRFTELKGIFACE